MDQNLPLTWKTSTRSHGPLSIEQTHEPGGLPKSWRISAVRRNAADLYLVVNDPMTGEPVEPDLMALLRDGCFDFDRSRETPEWQGF